MLVNTIFRVSYLASSPSRLMPNLGKGIASHLNLKEENEKLREVIANYKSLDLNLEYLTNENKNLRKVLNAENIINAQKELLKYISFIVENFKNHLTH